MPIELTREEQLQAQGWAAGVCGQSRESCPYDYPRPEWWEWTKGWDVGHAEWAKREKAKGTDKHDRVRMTVSVEATVRCVCGAAFEWSDSWRRHHPDPEDELHDALNDKGWDAVGYLCPNCKPSSSN